MASLSALLISSRNTADERAGRRRQVDGFDVVLVGADIADMRESEGDDLPGIGGIGENLLIPGHRRVEADLANRVPGGAEALPFEHGAVGQNEERRRPGVVPAAKIPLRPAIVPKRAGLRLAARGAVHGLLVAYYMSGRNQGPLLATVLCGRRETRGAAAVP